MKPGDLVLVVGMKSMMSVSSVDAKGVVHGVRVNKGGGIGKRSLKANAEDVEVCMRRISLFDDPGDHAA